MSVPTARNALHPAASVLPGHWTEYALLLLGGAAAAWPKPALGVIGIFCWLLSLLYGKRRWQVWFLDAVPAFGLALLFAPGVVDAVGLVFRILLVAMLAMYAVANATFPICHIPAVTGPFGVAGADVFLQRNGLEFRARLLHPAELSKLATPAPYVRRASRACGSKANNVFSDTCFTAGTLHADLRRFSKCKASCFRT